jgi:hypothetical protein
MAGARDREYSTVAGEPAPTVMSRFNKDEMRFAPILDAALAARDRGDFVQSLALFGTIIERAGSSCGRLLGVAHGLAAGVYYDHLNDPAAALPHALESVRFTPRSELASLGLFHCLATLRRWEDAFSEALRFVLVRGDSSSYRMILFDDTFLLF